MTGAINSRVDCGRHHKSPPWRHAMRILFLGAGAIGGYYGLQLAQAGADVAFMVRPGRVAQLAAEGLVVRTRGETRRQRVRTILAGQLNGSFDAVVLTCKAYDLPA